MSPIVSTRNSTPDENDATSMPSNAARKPPPSAQPVNLEQEKQRRAMLPRRRQTKGDEKWYHDSFMKQNKSIAMAIACKDFEITRATYDEWFQFCMTRLEEDCIFMKTIASNEAVWRKVFTRAGATIGLVSSSTAISLERGTTGSLTTSARLSQLG